MTLQLRPNIDRSDVVMILQCEGSGVISADEARDILFTETAPESGQEGGD